MFMLTSCNQGNNTKHNHKLIHVNKVDATCAKTCNVCGIQEGNTLGHSFNLDSIK